jgi:hypothetical protein
MNKTFEIIKLSIYYRKIKAYEYGNCVLDIIVDDYNVNGACIILEALGYIMKGENND